MPPHRGEEVPVHDGPHQQVPEVNGQMVTVPLAWFNEVLEVYYAAKADKLVPAHRAEPEPVVTEQAVPPGILELVPGFDTPGHGWVPKGAAANAPQQDEEVESEDGS